MNYKAIGTAGLAAMVLMGGVSSWADEPAKADEHMHHAENSKAPAAMEFTIVGVEYQGTKMWLPGTMIVKRGTPVTIKLINNIKSDPSTHGFAIDAYGVKVVVARGTTEKVEFTADKEGLFTIYCHQHPAHVGGQLLVIP